MTASREPLSPCVSFLRERESDCLHCAIRGSALFAEMEAADLDERLRPIHNGEIKGDGVIYRQGDLAEWVFTIRSGVVKLVGLRDSGSGPRILRLLGRGAAIGLESLDGGGYAHTAVAVRDSDLCRIPRSVLLDLGDRHPALLSGLVKKWQEHAYWSERWIGTLCTGKQAVRVPALICLIAEIGGDSLSAVRLPRSADMADILGCSLQGLSRRMAKLKRKGLLQRVAPWTYRCDPELIAQTHPARTPDPCDQPVDPAPPGT